MSKLKQKQKKKQKKSILKSKKLWATVCILAVGWSVLYLPAIIFPDNEDTKYTSLDVYENVLNIKDYPDLDFDKDGILNSKDDEPLIFDEASTRKLIEVTKKNDNETEETIKSPYQTDCGVVLWADSYKSKAKGDAVSLNGGYYVYDFKGWAHFPASDKKIAYAYDFEEKAYKVLEYNESQRAYKIDGDCFVQLLDEDVENVYTLSVLNKTKVINKGVVLSYILPSSGKALIKCGTNTEMIGSLARENEINDTFYEFKEEYLQTNTNEIFELIKVYNTLEGNQNVFVMLSNDKKISVGVIYGTDDAGNLLVANPTTKKYAGKIFVTPTTKRIVNGDNVEKQYLFEFSGFGYDSETSIINFFDACMP